MKLSDSILLAVLGILAILFCLSVFKNISYPLMWEDEAETAMFGERVMKYGYPKFHDGPNMVYQVKSHEPDLGVDVKTDAYIGSGWAMFYYSTIGLSLARHATDIYEKTALLRIPFAVMGVAGIFVMIITLAGFAGEGRRKRIAFAASFLFLELLSVTLVLHLREVRYYSLVIFFSACTLFVYLNHVYLRKFSPASYAIWMIICLLLLFMTFYPACFIFMIAAGSYEIFRAAAGRRSGDSAAAGGEGPPGKNFRNAIPGIIATLLPFGVSATIMVPLVLYFDIRHISTALAKACNMNPDMYLFNIRYTLAFFWTFDLLFLALVVKAVWTAVRLTSGRGRAGQLIGVRVSDFLTYFFVLYLGLICYTPCFLYVRYYLLLQPVLLFIILLDGFATVELIGESRWFRVMRYPRTVFAGLLIGAVALTVNRNFDQIGGHVTELTQQYRGCLDFTIPYIIDHYPEPSKLVIATNYEEASYMYYLRSRVTIGYIGLNIDEDMKLQPDVIVYRKWWRNHPKAFYNLMTRAEYREVAFPVTDYPVNNFPQLDVYYYHRFETFIPTIEQNRLRMYIRQ